MLILNRKRGQAILAGPIRVKVVEARGGRATLALEAPPEIQILREELSDRPPNQEEKP